MEKTTFQQEKEITDLMLQLGMRPHLLGFSYVRTGLEIILHSDIFLANQIGQVYSEVAKIHHTTLSRVEKDIRHVIEETFYRNPDHFKAFFRNSVWTKQPSNAELMAIFAEKIKMGY